MTIRNQKEFTNRIGGANYKSIKGTVEHLRADGELHARTIQTDDDVMELMREVIYKGRHCRSLPFPLPSLQSRSRRL